MAQHQDGTGAASGRVRTVLQLEGGMVFLATSALYFGVGGSFWLYALLLFAPDLSFLGYAAGRKAGAVVYNLAHSYVLPIALGAIGILSQVELMQHLALIHLAHIGLDRTLGYGLKYASGFKHTHLGQLGRKNPA